MRLIRFGVENSVPVNLLMCAMLFAGFYGAVTIRRQIFPELNPRTVLVSVPYPGATPTELEDTVALKIEEKLDDIDEIDEFNGQLFEGMGSYTIQLKDGVDADRAVNKIEQSINALQDLPDELEKIQVTLIEPRLPVIRLTVYGELGERELKNSLNQIRDELRTLDGMGEIIVEGVRPYEISVDVDSSSLMEHRLSLPTVAQNVRSWMREIPGGTVRGQGGDVRVRTLGVEESIDSMGEIVVKGSSEGRALRLNQIADIKSGFVDSQYSTRFNGEKAGSLTIFKVGAQDIIKIAEMVRAYIDGRNGVELESQVWDAALRKHIRDAWELGNRNAQAYPLPSGAKLATNTDISSYVEGRLYLLMNNAGTGAFLVFLTLFVFLNWRVAFWVGVGLTTALLGTLLVMWGLDITLDMLTMFGLILVLGLLVDDAIVVAENIQSQHEQGNLSHASSISGASQVFWPVCATVLTSIVAFLPLRFVDGEIGTMLGALPLVVACALAMSLVESILILPNHMAHSLHAQERRQSSGVLAALLKRYETARDRVLHERVIPLYTSVLKLALRYRYVSMTMAFSLIVVSLGLLGTGHLAFIFIPDDDAQVFEMSLRMPIGTPIEQTNAIVERIENTAREIPEVSALITLIGVSTNVQTGASDGSATHKAQIFAELVPPDQRERTSHEIADKIREDLRAVQDQVERLTVQQINGGAGGADISVQLFGDRLSAGDMKQAADDLKQIFRTMDGVEDVSDDHDIGQMELRVSLKPGAKMLGFDVANVASQVRGFLFGARAHTFVSEGEDVEVRVRLDEESRRNLWRVENAWLISPKGERVPLSEIATIDESSTYTAIRREEGHRSINVGADVKSNVLPGEVVALLTKPRSEKEVLMRDEFRGLVIADDVQDAPESQRKLSILDAFRRKYPQITIEFGGAQQQQAEAFATLPMGLLFAILMIYIILACLFRSYVQPLVVLSAVPFAIVGVIWGHYVLGYNLTFLSLIGFVALSGIVVNDSLIFVEFFNKRREQGEDIATALVSAGRARFRAIFLTTLTTIVGLSPLILEESFHAQFIVTMAVSVAMGLMSATVLILLVLPCMMLALDDVRRVFSRLWYGPPI